MDLFISINSLLWALVFVFDSWGSGKFRIHTSRPFTPFTVSAFRDIKYVSDMKSKIITYIFAFSQVLNITAWMIS